MARVARRRRLAAPEAALALFYAASALGFAASQRWPGAWLLVAPAVAGLALDLDDVGDRLRRRGERDAWLLVVLAAVLGVSWSVYALIGPEMVDVLRGVVGSGLLLMGAFFMAGIRVWPPGRGLVPTGLASLVICGLDPAAPTALPTAVAGLALFVWLALERPTRRPSGASARRAVAPLVVYAALAAGVAGGLVVLLPWAQPYVESAAARALSGAMEARTGLSGSSRLGDFEELALSRKPALRLWADRPLRLRSGVFTRFDGRTWTEGVGTPAPLRQAATAAARALEAPLAAQAPGTTFLVSDAPSADVELARIVTIEVDRGLLVAPRGVRLLRVSGGTPLADGAGVLWAPFWPPPPLYGLAHAPPPLVEPTEEQRAAALQLPEGLDPRLRELASRLSAGAGSDRERVERTRDWLGRECRYSLEVGAFRTDQPLAEFLFEKKRGYCEYFASAAAVLLRLQGVPTRYAAGYNVRDQSRRGDHYLVRASDAHAWIEAWVDGRGWVESDPTPADQYDALRAGMDDGPAARLWESVASFFALLQAQFRYGPAEALRWLGRQVAELGSALYARGPLVPAALAAALVAWLGLRRWRRRTRTRRRSLAPVPLSVGPELASLLRTLERRWSDAGHPRPPHRAPLEHLETIPEDALAPRERAACRDLVDCYYRARFGGREPGSQELAALRQALERERSG